MSLLMDALKKAEKDKKKAADGSKPEGTAGRASDPGLTTVGLPAEELATSGLALEPLLGEGPGAAPAGAVTEALDPIPPGGGALDVTGYAAEGDSGALGPRGAVLAPAELKVAPALDRESTLPSKRAINASLKDYFESSQSVERSRAAAVPGDASGPRVFRVGDTVSRVSADTVFSATRRSSLPKTVSWGLWVASLVGVTVGGLWVWSELGSSGGMTAQRPLPPPASSPAPAASIPGTTMPAPVPPAPGAASEALAEAPALAPPRPEPEPAPAPGLVPPPDEPEALVQSPASEEPDLPEGPALDELPPEGPPVAGFTAPPPYAGASAITIRKSPAPRRVDPELSAAYRAFQSGDLARAEGLYRRVQLQDPDRRDALLGLAAVAMRQGRAEQAYRYYRRLAEIDPRDSVALAGIASLEGRGAREASESRLKLLLDQSPDAPHLNFALGNVYAGGGRWAEAQGAYFKAYAGDSRNPDYAFNLAVSLDQMGQGKAALGFYRRALEAADRETGGFNTADVLTRIRTLSSAPSEP
jgi:Flp pilus assembly protein TadD